jgi:RNA polymerase sigma-70 factor (ECF subfamily)
MEAVLTRQDIFRIWPHLSLAHREVLLLVGLEGYTEAEAAKMLDVPVGTVASRMARARQVAQRLLAETS